MEDVKVDKQTVGQYTGLKAKGGVSIYEGDILKEKWDYERNEPDSEESETIYVEDKGVVIYDNDRFSLLGGTSKWIYHSVEVIGNETDNPELLNP